MADEKQKVFKDALYAMAKFRKTFGRSLEPSFVAELHVAMKLGLEISSEVNMPGYDAVSTDGKRYQIKYRSKNTLNVDINNFEFDYIILVNLNEDYQPIGMWQLNTGQAKNTFTPRDKFRKYQTTQNMFKKIAKRIL